ncbi:MAG: nucleotidyl transferase AbiEii/AbiGii toxin family protein [Fimbriimonadaceae bacterium]
MALNPAWKEFVELLNTHKVEYVIVGAFALAFHGHPRYTGDIDFFVRDSEANAKRLLAALTAFGFGSLGLEVDDFRGGPGVVQLGVPPRRIDILTRIESVSFDRAWSNRVVGHLDGLTVNYIGEADFLANKRALARPKDLADVDALAP